MQEPNVLFLDEPTNDLDIQTLNVLEDYLDYFPGVVVTVSHDRYFLDRVVDHLLVFENRKINRFQGSYTEYMEEKVEKQQFESTKKKKRRSKQKLKLKKEKKKALI